ncbi:MAG: hypothetical protein U0326_29810 [Polyangiales bacterium]
MWTIRTAQMNAIADETFERVVARITAATAAEYPEVWFALREGFEPWVRGLLNSAVTLDITREENLRRFVAWNADLGVETSLAEEHPWAIEMLGVTDEDEEARIEAVELRLQGLEGEP